MKVKVEYIVVPLTIIAGALQFYLRLPRGPQTLNEARAGFKTTLIARPEETHRLAPPPAEVFRVVKYSSEIGQLPAYLTPDPKDGRKHPAIIWIKGGSPGYLGELWRKGRRSNDQSASQYRERGIVMMFPALRGGNLNVGREEGFLGEVNDVIAATEYLK